MSIRRGPVALLFCFALPVAAAAEAQPAITDLTGAGVAQNQFAQAVNEAGTAVGWISEDGINQAVAWTSGAMIRLPGFCATCPSQAMGINDFGDIAGVASQADGTRRAVVWHGNAMTTVLAPLAGDAESTAADINNQGEVAGSSGTGFFTRPVVWRGGVGGVLGGSDPPVFMSGANAINESGDAVGINYSNLGGRPFQWRGGVFSELDSANATGPALDINDHGAVVGLRISGGRPMATVWVDGVRRDVSSDPWSVAAGINNRGQIVGYSGAGPATVAGTLWDNGAPTILGGTVANDINEAGRAVGTGTVVVNGVPYTHALAFQLETPQSLLEELLATVTDAGPGASLASKVTDAMAAFGSGDTAGACSILNALLNQVRAQAGKKLTATQAADITAQVTHLRSLIGC